MQTEKCKVGDIVNGWKIVEIFVKNIGSQNIQKAKIKSVIGRPREREVRLTLLTNKKIGWADNRRYVENNSQRTHGLTKHKLYNIYNAMNHRCYDVKHISYKNYGAKGIYVCDEWKNNFLSYYRWCLDNGWKEGMSIDRINHNLSYCPENCRIVLKSENYKHTNRTVYITAFGETKLAQEWYSDNRCKTSYTSLLYRINQGWKPEEAITTPNKQKDYDNFKQHKMFYQFCKEKHPEIIQEYLSL